MVEIVAIVEGETELTFAQTQLRPHFGLLGISFWARLPGRVHRRGGVRAWQSVRDDILRTLKEHRGRICTTMFDFYGMPNDWPGRLEAASKPYNEKGPCIESALLQDVLALAGQDFRPELFIPYVQIHEFEAMLFSSPPQLAEMLTSLSWPPPRSNLEENLKEIIDSHASPEEIDDSPETAPSKRILRIAKTYQKRIHGPIVAERIGLQTMRQHCAHFNNWISRLEQCALVR